MKTKTAVDDALARLSRAIDRPWDNGSLPSYEDASSPVARFVNRWTKPAPTGFTGTLPLSTADPSTTPPDARGGQVTAPPAQPNQRHQHDRPARRGRGRADRSDAPAYPTDDPDLPPPHLVRSRPERSPARGTDSHTLPPDRTPPSRDNELSPDPAAHDLPAADPEIQPGLTCLTGRRRGSSRDFEPVEPQAGDYLFLAEDVDPARQPDPSPPTHTIDGTWKAGRTHDGKHQHDPLDSEDGLPEPDQFAPAAPPRRRLVPRVPRLAAILAVLAGALLAGYLALPSAPEPTGAAAPPAPIPLTAEPPTRTVTIDVQGKVRKPGLQHLPEGSRVHDAIKSSGGALPGTDTSTLNLARRLTDGEQINVGVPPTAADPAMQQPLTNLNTAPVYQLDALPGVGIVTAQRIVEYRNRQPFTDVDQLRQIEGIGPTRFNRLKDLVTVN